MNKYALLFSFSALLSVIGCGPADDRVAQYAQWSVYQQSQQNVEQAKENQSLLNAQRTLHDGVQQERSSLDRQREDLAAERREVASQRAHDPIIAEAVEVVGLTLACLAPLVITAYALRQARIGSVDDALGEVLIHELTDPKLLRVTEPVASLPSPVNQPL